MNKQRAILLLKKSTHIFLNLLIIVLTAGLLFSIHHEIFFIKNYFITNIYFKQINPQAGARKYEIEYKKKLNYADELRIKANAFVEDSQRKTFEETGDSSENLNQNFRRTIFTLLNDRQQMLQRLIEIDKLAMDLNLPDEYKQFYEKRLYADSNEYDAFLDYKKGIDTMAKSLVLADLNNLYHPFMAYLVDTEIQPKDETYIELHKSQFESYFDFYIVPLIESGFFTEELSANLYNQRETLRVIANFQLAHIQNNEELARKYAEEIYWLSLQDSGKTAVELYLEWSEEKIFPYFYAQDKKHEESYMLYKDAYDFAETHELNEVLTIWESEYPYIQEIENSDLLRVL